MGLTEYRQGRFRTYGRRYGFAPAVVLTLLTDRDGALWVGTDGGGVTRFAEGKFSSYQTRDGLSNQVIRCLYEDSEGSLWMGTDGGGVNRFKEYRVTMRSMREGLPSDSVRSVQQDRSGDIWLGTTNGIARLPASGGVTVYNSKDGLARDLMWPVIRDRHDNVWAASEAGVPHSAAQTADGLGLETSTRVAPCLPVLHGTFAGTSRGTQRLDHGQFGPVLARSGGPGQFVLGMYGDHAGSMWVLTRSGLNRIAGTHLTPYTPAEGMPNLDVCWIFEDDDGFLWIAGRDGLLRVSRSDLDAVAEGRKRAVEPQRFGVADGMRGSSDFSAGSSPSAWKGRDNKLYFATYGGMLEIDPARLIKNRRAPPVVIERVTDGRQDPVGAGGWIGAGGNLEFHYTALSFVFPEFLRFRYRLEGFDAGWVEAGNRRAAFSWKPGHASIRPFGSPDSVWQRRPRRGRTLSTPRATAAPERAQTRGACRGTHG